MKKTSEMTQECITQEGKTESGNVAEVFFQAAMMTHPAPAVRREGF